MEFNYHGLAILPGSRVSIFYIMWDRIPVNIILASGLTFYPAIYMQLTTENMSVMSIGSQMRSFCQKSYSPVIIMAVFIKMSCLRICHMRGMQTVGQGIRFRARTTNAKTLSYIVFWIGANQLGQVSRIEFQNTYNWHISIAFYHTKSSSNTLFQNFKFKIL